VDDFVFNARQIGQYPLLTAGVGPADLVLVQQNGVGGPYGSVETSALVATAMAQGGLIQLLPGGTGGLSFSGQTLTFNNGQFGFTTAVAAPSMNTDALTINGFPAATQMFVFEQLQIVNGQIEFLALNTVRSFNGRVGDIQLELPDILRGGGAPNDNPRFGGIPRANSDWDARTNDDRLATAEWVHRAICFDLEQWLRIQPLVFTFNGRAGNITLTAQDITDAGFATPGQFPRAPTPPLFDASTRIATTAFVDETVQDATTYITIQLAQLGQSVTDFLAASYAPLDSPQFVGIPAGPTANPGTSTGQLATTAFVAAAVVASTTGVATWNGRTGDVLFEQTDLTAAGGALLASPTFTGTPHAPTAAPGTNTTQLATTAFVEAATSGSVSGVSSFNTRTGDVTLTLADVQATNILTDTALLGLPTAPTPPTADNDQSIATTAFVKAVIATLTPGGVTSFNGRTGAISLLGSDVSAAGGALSASPTFTGIPAAPTAALGTSTTQLATTAFVINQLVQLNYAPLASPAFTGTPTAPTAAPGTANTQLATTAFVAAAVSAVVAGVVSFNGRTGAVTLTAADVIGTNVLNNTSLTGVPIAPTAATATNTTQLATTAFVQAAIAAAPTGVSSFNTRTGAVTLTAADISAAGGAPINSPTFTGTPKSTTPVGTSNDTSIATTAFVMAQLAAGGGVTSFNGRAGAITLTASDIASTGAAPLGGKLRFSSSSVLTFRPYRGSYVKINGVSYPIPNAGIAGLGNTGVYVNGVAGQNLATGVYLVAVFNNAGVLTGDFLNGWSHRACLNTPGNEGVEIAYNGGVEFPLRSIIGLVYCQGGLFLDSLQYRYTRSWFNEPPLQVATASFTFTSITDTGAFQAIGLPISMATWGGETVDAGGFGFAYNNVAGNSIYTTLLLNGGQVSGAIGQGYTTSSNANDFGTVAPHVTFAANEGVYSVQFGAFVSGGTGAVTAYMRALLSGSP
jgi:hypothetical protein